MLDRTITVVGAGITGLWQALILARKGYHVRLIERSSVPFADAASAYAGAMLGPFCEKEVYAPVVRDLGLRSIALWTRTYPGAAIEGTLVLAGARDRSEIDHFAGQTEGHQRIGDEEIADLEPDLRGRFNTGLFYAEEGHVAPRAAMNFLLGEIKRAGAEVAFDTEWQNIAAKDGLVIDCRGLGARTDLTGLRGVRGERLIVRTHEIHLHRPVRLLHPRHPVYIVPWGDGLFMIGATVIESDDTGPVTVRSILELLGMAYALHPAFGEAQVIEAGAGVRPAFPDNVPKIGVCNEVIYVNGLYRHGFLLAPALAELVAAFLENGAVDTRLFVTNLGE